MTFLVRHTVEGEILNDNGICILGNSDSGNLYLCDLITAEAFAKVENKNYIQALEEAKSFQDKKGLNALNKTIAELKEKYFYFQRYGVDRLC